MATNQEIEQAIAVLESQRTVLGEEVVETSLAALRQQLAELNQRKLPARRIGLNENRSPSCLPTSPALRP